MRLTLPIAAALLLASCADDDGAGENQAGATTMDDAAFEAQLVRVLDRNPGIVLEALETFQRRAEEQDVAAVLPELASARYGHAIGASEEDASLILVEFFDYHCGFCKSAMEDVLALVEADPTVRVVFQELPILREESRDAAEIALAAAELEEDGYRRVHRSLLNTSGLLDEAAVDSALRRAGFEPQEVRGVLEERSAEISETIDRSLAAAQQLRVRGTPYFIAANPETGQFDVLEGYRAEEFESFVQGARGK
jgi:protein-disulfide isomerase